MKLKKLKMMLKTYNLYPNIAYYNYNLNQPFQYPKFIWVMIPINYAHIMPLFTRFNIIN